jgi:hypothetical protein
MFPFVMTARSLKLSIEFKGYQLLIITGKKKKKKKLTTGCVPTTYY